MLYILLQYVASLIPLSSSGAVLYHSLLKFKGCCLLALPPSWRAEHGPQPPQSHFHKIVTRVKDADETLGQNLHSLRLRDRHATIDLKPELMPRKTCVACRQMRGRVRRGSGMRVREMRVNLRSICSLRGCAQGRITVQGKLSSRSKIAIGTPISSCEHWIEPISTRAKG